MEGKVQDKVEQKCEKESQIREKNKKIGGQFIRSNVSVKGEKSIKETGIFSEN